MQACLVFYNVPLLHACVFLIPSSIGKKCPEAHVFRSFSVEELSSSPDATVNPRSSEHEAIRKLPRWQAWLRSGHSARARPIALAAQGEPDLLHTWICMRL